MKKKGENLKTVAQKVYEVLRHKTERNLTTLTNNFSVRSPVGKQTDVLEKIKNK
jgi:hypothetical protein